MSDASRGRTDSDAFVLDCDGHVIEPPKLWAEYTEKRFRNRIPRPARDENGNFGYIVDDRYIMRTASSLAAPPRTADGKLPAGGWDPGQRLRDMDSEGIDIAILYPTLSFFFPEIPDGELHAALCRAYNDWLADYCKADPGRLIGVALLPLENVDASIRELERTTHAYGFRGAFFRPNPYAGRAIQDPDYEPFWDCAQSLGVPITVHEGISDALPTLGRDRSTNPVMLHLMSHPFEQMAACAGLVLGGVLERHPKLRFVFLESGCGWLPYWLERMDGHWQTWSSHLPEIKMKPSDCFQRQCFVSMDPDDETAPGVIEQVGDDVLVWASDYPHIDSPFPGAVKETLEVLCEVPAQSRRKLLGTNGLRLYGLDAPR
jgi:predicted TIM-barrel fold metal-dependent hydrolase